MSEDNWKHRSQNMKCSTCMWFAEKQRSLLVDDSKAPIGRCRRRAPSINGFPVVFGTDWCGDHKINEDAV